MHLEEARCAEAHRNSNLLAFPRKNSIFVFSIFITWNIVITDMLPITITMPAGFVVSRILITVYSGGIINEYVITYTRMIFFFFGTLSLN